jgi:cytochrome oxidase Cu insertion factor (SCO1/SenC/PrrC family)
MKKMLRYALSALLMSPFLLWQTAVSAHPERVSGVVLSVLPARPAVVLRLDAIGSQPSVTTMYELSPRVDVRQLHDGDRLVGLIDGDVNPKMLDEVRDTPPPPPKSIIRPVVPLLPGDQMPQTRFVDQRGRPFTFGDFHGKAVFLAFIYTRCSDKAECPLISSHFAVLQRRFADGPYHLVEMTLDPAFDKPNVLATYAARYGADPNRWTFGTGNPETVLDFDARFGIDPFADPRVGLIHTERGVLIDPNGRIIDLIEGTGWTPDDVAARLNATKNNATAWISLVDYYLSRVTVAICGNGATGFNGLEDLAIIIAILGGVGFGLQRLARFFMVRE